MSADVGDEAREALLDERRRVQRDAAAVAGATAVLAVCSFAFQLPQQLASASGAVPFDDLVLLLAGAHLFMMLFGARRAADLKAELRRRSEAEAGLRHAARHDALTGLVNRAGLISDLQAATADAADGGPSVTVLLLDLDHFKPINDTFGHAVGDGLLQALKDRLRGCLRPDVTVGRLGGDEFLLIVRGHSPTDVDAMTDRLLAELRRPFPVADRWLRVDGSIGTATMPSEGVTDVAGLLRRADMAMYESKMAKRQALPGLGSRRDEQPFPGAADMSSAKLIGLARLVLGMDLVFLSRMDDDRQTFAVVDAGSSAIPLKPGTNIAAGDGFCQLLLDGAIPPVVPDLAAEPALAAMPVVSELGVGAYCGVPVVLPDGRLYGTLCGLHTEPFAVGAGQLAALGVIAGLVGHILDRELRADVVRQARQDAFAAFVDGPRRRLVLQPIVDLGSGERVGFEALSRFTDEDGRPCSPDGVFAEARDLCLLGALELACARTALEQVAALPPDTYLSVNLSPDTLLDPATRRLLATADAERVVIEITEHDQVTDYAAIRNALAPLRSNGLRLAVDTGAGFASLQHLTELSPEIVKLDVAFVRSIDTDASRRAVARAVTGYATEVGATVVAEGVENAEQAAVLRRLGVDCGQGWFYGRPEAPEQHWPARRAPHGGGPEAEVTAGLTG